MLNLQIAINAANEGIPVAAIARVITVPLDDVYQMLRDAKESGAIIDLPKADWPPGSRISDRTPALPADADLHFLCHKTFRLTALEAGFVVVLMKHSHSTKTRLHGVIEQMRLTRSSQPDTMESTDPKMVDVIICKLRKKLKKVDPAIEITTIWGGGYHIEAHVKALIMTKLSGEPHAKPQAKAPAAGTDGDAATEAFSRAENEH